MPTIQELIDDVELNSIEVDRYHLIFELNNAKELFVSNLSDDLTEVIGYTRLDDDYRIEAIKLILQIKDFKNIKIAKKDGCLFVRGGLYG